MKTTRHLKAVREFQNDESGAVLVWVSAMIVVILGFVALAIDGARYLNLNSNMQQIADAAALAGAKRLDGSQNAIENARSDALNYLSNQPTWSDIAAAGVQIASVDFYSAAPGPGVTALTDTQDKQAVYIKVTTVRRGITTSFAAAIDAAKNPNTRAIAVAKASFSICQPVQSWMCNPWENANPNPGTAQNWASNVNVGRMFLLGDGSGGGSGSGNWGLIDPLVGGGSSVNALAPFWATNTTGTCQTREITDTPLEVLTGNAAQHAVDGMNVRFDRPYGSGYTAAPIVIDGYKKGGSCNSPPGSATPPSNGSQNAVTFKQTNVDASAYQTYCNRITPNRYGSCPFPRDRTIAAPDATWSTSAPVPVGGGPVLADLQAYWRNQHAPLAYPTDTSGKYPTDVNGNILSRYGLYEKELELASTDFKNSPNPERYTPECVTADTTAARRLVNVAIVDCTYAGITGGSADLPLFTTTAKFFMTEPATDSWNTPSLPSSLKGRIYAEFVGAYAVNQDGGSVFQIVELVNSKPWED